MGVNAFLQYIRKAAILLIVMSLPAAAQTGLGTVRGTVQDASKAVLVGAKVKLTNTATGIAQETQSNSAGVYYFGSVQIGPYRLNVESQGFKAWEATLTVEAGATVVIDPAMEVGNATAKVEVTDAAPVIATEGAQ